MTILYIGGFQLPDKNAAAHRVLNTGRLLRDLGHRVVFIDTQIGTEPRVPVSATHHLVDGFDTYSVPYPKSWTSWFKYATSKDAFEYVASQYGDVTLGVFYDCPAIALARIRRFCRTNHVKTIADVTEWYGSTGNGLRDLAKLLDTFLRMRIEHHKMDGLFVISEYLRDFYNGHPHVLLLPPLVDLAETKWQTEAVRKERHDRVSFVYSGSPGAKKDKLNTMVECFHGLRTYDNFDFNVVGLTRGDYEELHPRHSEFLDELSDRIIFHGRLPHGDSLELVKTADYSLLIRDGSKSNRAGFPTKYVESVSAGTRVIANAVGSLTADLIASHDGVLVDSPTSGALTRALIPILEDPAAGADGVPADTISQIYDFRHWEDQVETFLREVRL